MEKIIKRLRSEERLGPGTPTIVHHDIFRYKLTPEEYEALKASGANLTRLGGVAYPSQITEYPKPVEGYMVYSSTPNLRLEKKFPGFQTTIEDVASRT